MSDRSVAKWRHPYGSALINGCAAIPTGTANVVSRQARHDGFFTNLKV